MVNHTQAICRITADEFFECDHFVVSPLRRLNISQFERISNIVLFPQTLP